MKRRNRKRNKRKHYDHAGKQHKPQSHRPTNDAAEVTRLRQALKSAKRTNRRLASFKKQVWRYIQLEICWNQERCQLIYENRCLQRTLGTKYNHAKKEISRLQGVLMETKRAHWQKENERHQADLNNTLHEIKVEGKDGALKTEKTTPAKGQE